MAKVLQKDIYYLGKDHRRHEWQYLKTEQLFYWEPGTDVVEADNPPANLKIEAANGDKALTRTDAKRTISNYLSRQFSR